jgi:esterase/lipase
MAKFEEVYEDTLELFQKHIDLTSIPRMVKIKILSNDSIKKEFGKVSKASEIVKFMTDYDVVIQVNEPIFDQLEEKQKEYVVKDLLAQICYDMEKDKISILSPDITTFSGVLRNYDIDTYLSIKESMVTLLEQKRIEEDAKK